MLRLLEGPTHPRGIKLKILRAQIKAGTERGEFTEVDSADLDGYLERLTTLAATRTPQHLDDSL